MIQDKHFYNFRMGSASAGKSRPSCCC